MRIRFKLAAIVVLVLLLSLPLLLIVSKIYERDSYSDQAHQDIARSWTGAQKILGPILVIPYTRTYEKREFDNQLKRHVTNQYRVDEQLFLLPESLETDVELNTEIRYRGIYEVPVYNSSIHLAGQFSTRRATELDQRHDVVAVGKPFLSIVVNDMRGIAEPPILGWSAGEVRFLPGSHLDFQSNGIHAPLEHLDTDTNSTYRFTVSLALRGMSSFRFAPIGDANRTTIKSGWPHPGFEGLYLPTQREISREGFTAHWQTSAFATNMNRKADNCALGECAAFVSSYFGVQLIDPVDVYLQAQRASKYAILFIGLTFTAFFLFEILKNLAIHPIQYGLVGLALIVFYLLLISLAEHIRFASAYAIATLSCSGLLAYYISYVLGSARRGLAFGAAIAALYAVLYVIIQEEDFAFSMGSALVFVALSGVMYLTRKVDWFQVGKTSAGKSNE